MIDTIFLVGLLAATIRVATPLIFGGLGEIITERSGVLNLGIEGTMLLGALMGFLVAYFTESLWLGILAAAGVGMVLGFLMGILTVSLGLNQHVSGLGLTLLASGLALFVFRLAFGEPSVPPQVEPLGYINVPFFNHWPIVNPITRQYPLTYLALLLIPIAHILMFFTPFGLQLRAVGELPEAVDTCGVNVYRIRYITLIVGGGLMGVGGAFLSVAQLGAFTYGIVAGRGWVCIALVIFGNWTPAGVMLGALLFGGVEALQLRLQTVGFDIPHQIFLALPYVVTIAALAFTRRKTSGPAALLKPYRKE